MIFHIFLYFYQRVTCVSTCFDTRTHGKKIHRRNALGMVWRPSFTDFSLVYPQSAVCEMMKVSCTYLNKVKYSVAIYRMIHDDPTFSTPREDTDLQFRRVRCIQRSPNHLTKSCSDLQCHSQLVVSKQDDHP